MPDPDLTDAQARQDIRGGLPAGTVLGNYELKSIIGKGAFGITYRARDLTLSRDVAIKEYLPTSLALREGRTTVMPISTDHAEQFAWGRERFIEEARTLTRLEGTPAIVRAHDFLEANGTAYMVMALIEGENLNKRLMRERRLEPEAVERLLFPLLDGLEAVHAIGFLHRDIKPANIMIDGHGLPTLIDFGAARAAMAGRSTTMTAIFTPGYAAAEQYTSTGLGPWTDIYGLSATFYHAITGNTPPSSIDRILNDTYEPLGDLMPDGYDPAVLDGIDAGMVVRVDDRPRSINEWRQILRSSSQGATRVARKPGPLARVARRTSKARLTIRGPALWGAIAASVVVVAGAGYLALTYNAPTTINTAALNLSAEQLEQALAERRKADTLAAEKRRLEEQARQKAEADAVAMRQADEELERARQARLKAEQEAAELKASIEARRQAHPEPRDQAAATQQRAAEEEAQRKAEADAAALRQAEEEATKKAEADAEAKRQADQALAMAEAQRKQAEADAQTKADAEAAARSQASEEAQRKAETEAAARRQADELQAKEQAERDKVEAEAKIKAEAAAAAKIKEEAEAAEKALRLDRPDRERLQVALTSLGFDTRGNDGIFGPRTREMIAAWQKARNQPATGFITATQQQTLFKEAEPALAKRDEIKKTEEESKNLVASAIKASVPDASADGLWRGRLNCDREPRFVPFSLDLEMRLTNGEGAWTAGNPSASNGMTVTVRIAVAGSEVTAVRGHIGGGDSANRLMSGRLDGNNIRASNSFCNIALTRGGTPAPAAAIALPDGTYSGGLVLDYGIVTHFSVQFRNGVGTGTVTRAGCGSRPLSLRVAPSGDVTGEGGLFSYTCNFSPAPVTGRLDGVRLLLGVVTGFGGGGNRRRDFVLAQGGGETTDTALSTGSAQSPSGARSGPSIAAAQSPDGLWRGTYKCGPTIGIGRSEGFSLPFEIRLKGGSGVWRSPSNEPIEETVEIRVSIDGNTVKAERFRLGGAGSFGYSGMSRPGQISGRYDGTTISADGREAITPNRQCELNLSRS